MYDREVRSGKPRRKVRNKGGTTTRRPSLALLDPLLMNSRARVSHHHSTCRAAVRTCRAAMELTYKAIQQGGIPPTAVISAPGLLVGSGMDPVLRRGFLHAEPRARLHKMARTGALMLRFRGGDRERSSTRRDEGGSYEIVVVEQIQSTWWLIPDNRFSKCQKNVKSVIQA